MTRSDNTTPHPAQLYDDHISSTIPYYGCFHEETINIVKAVMKEPGLWLDTGCGTGTLVTKCLDVFSKTKFYMVDPSREMILQAKKKLDTHAGGRVKFLEPAATQQLDLKPDIHFDVVTAIQCHHYMLAEERIAATRVCYDALNIGGVFITFENIRPMTVTGIEIGKRNWGNYQLSEGKDQKQVTSHLERFDVEYFPITIEKHVELYRNFGFLAVEILWFSYMQAGFYCIK
jgi:tRNA (cmo5U34)-methyltransferase